MNLWQALEASAEGADRRVFLAGSLGGGATRAELLAMARRLIAAFRHWGVTAGDRVAVLASASKELVACQWALAGLGAIQVPINTSWRGLLLADLLRDTEPRLIVASVDQAEKLDDPHVHAGWRAPLLMIGEAVAAPTAARYAWQEALSFAPQEAAPVASHAPLVILFTSGTTGRSKGVVLSHRWGIDYSLRANAALGIEPGDRHYGFLPLFHIAGQYAHVVGAALAGASVALCEPFRASSFWQEVETHGCTAAVLMSSMVAAVRASYPATGSPLRKLHLIPLPPDFVALGKKFACHISTNYGSTEASIPLMNRSPTDARSCGTLCEGYEARIVDEWDQALPDGTAGELVLRPAQPWTVMSEYWGRPEATSAAWRNGWLHTGDIFVRRADQHFEFVDRAKDAIRRKGENISTFELEMLACLHPEVEEAAAVGIDTDAQDQEVALFYVSKSPSPLAPSRLVEHLEAVAPRFMVPRYLCAMASLPRTDTGKVQKAQLRGVGPASLWDRRER
ncbi:AMP-binding protein [Variovorax sp. PBL-E5]|uniref:AMP-binding protein n=1 Tax=Variovorax sp. PBL-E5 TaxID=434014 RepID=UPI00131822DC|nr:AMP-binding protein [Variovorax sp. PBL-E5]VTU23107.1 putative sulfoacetate--CoA ligase [Variovorax sp. PBL-E5]